jgi:Zn-finger nucleic acid-binding protein
MKVAAGCDYLVTKDTHPSTRKETHSRCACILKGECNPLGVFRVCPKCNEPLIIVEFQCVEVDYCPDCQGTWFDAGELELVSEMAGVPAGRLHRALQAARHARSGQRRCPRCRRKMQVVTIGDCPAVEVERCPAGDGLWLDAGELQTVVREFADDEDAAVVGFLSDLLGHGLARKSEDG